MNWKTESWSIPVKCLIRVAIWSTVGLSLPERDEVPASCQQGVNVPYVSTNNLAFDVYCDYNIQGRELAIYTIDTLEKCMDACATFISATCYGVTYRARDSQCFLKDSSTSVSDLFQESGIQAALANTVQLNDFDTDCPFPDGSTQQVEDAPKFRIKCGKDLPSLDYYPDGVSMWHHSDNLTDCLQWCSRQHPLCKAVSYNPDMLSGYINCYPKHDAADRDLKNPKFVVHSAIAVFEEIKNSCADNTRHSKGNRDFKLSCENGSSGGSNITSFHESSLESCIDRCTTLNGEQCQGIAFQASMDYGFDNCYLQNASGTAYPLPGWASAVITDEPASGDSAASSTTASSGSKGWIAGPVIGAIAAIALVVGAFFWFRRRRGSKFNLSAPEHDDGTAGPTELESKHFQPSEVSGDPATAYRSGSGPYTRHELSQTSESTRPSFVGSELQDNYSWAGRQRHELDARGLGQESTTPLMQ